MRHLAAAADTLLVLATSEPTSLTDAYAVLKLYAADRPGGDARVIVNQAANRRPESAPTRPCAAPPWRSSGKPRRWPA